MATNGQGAGRSYRRLRVVLDACTAPPPQQAVLEAVARPDAADATTGLRDLVAHPNVVAVGIAEKESNGQRTGRLALAFYVEQKKPLDELQPWEMIPPVVSAAVAGDDVVTDVVQLGRLVPEVLVQHTPIEPGFSVGHPAVTAGTLGAVIGPADNPRILSNSHVLANSGLANIGDPILYPGKLDNGEEPGDIVGTLTQIVPFVTGGEFVNHMDVAVATISPARRAELRSRIAALGIVPVGTTNPVRGMKVVKVGRTTGLTNGEVRDVNFRFSLDYGGGRMVGYVDQVLCTRYSDGGDSGSLVLEEGTSKAVGLHFAGADGGSVFSPIRPILRAVRGRLLGAAIGE